MLKKFVLIIFFTAGLVSISYARVTLCYRFNHIGHPEIVENIKASLLLNKKNCREFANLKELRKAVKESKQQIKQAIQPYGYFSPAITLWNLNYIEEWENAFDSKRYWLAEINICSFILFFLFSSPIYASCLSIINQIHHDINKYGDTIKMQKLEWMNLAWLNKHLHKPQVIQQKNAYTEYQWTCFDAPDVSLTAVFDNTQKPVAFSGKYNSDAGAGIFTVAMINSDSSLQNQANQEPVSSAPPTTMPTTPPTPNTNTPTNQVNTCSNMAAKMYDSYNSNTGSNDQVWPSLDLALNSLGQPGKHETSSDNILHWNTGDFLGYSVVFSKDGKLSVQIGDAPPSVKNYSGEITKAVFIKLLGNPNEEKTINSETYTWYCPDKSIISIEKNEDGSVNYNGLYQGHIFTHVSQ